MPELSRATARQYLRRRSVSVANALQEVREDVTMLTHLRPLAHDVRTDFSTVERALVFVGYPRSGHSLVGALVAAHPDVLLSHELNLLSLQRRRLSRDRLLRLIVARDRDFASMGREWEGFDYSVSGWSGEASRPRVIGDKKGSGTTLVLSRRPDALDRLQATLGVPVHVLHVTRHPLDNVATIARREESDLTKALGKYRARTETAAAARARWPSYQWMDLAYEDLVDDVRGKVREIVEWLGLDASKGYLTACEEAVFPSPRRSRDHVDTSGIAADVLQLTDQYEFLWTYRP